MCLGAVGLAIVLNNLWLLGTLAPFAVINRYGVVAREETYLHLGEVDRLGPLAPVR
jgi:hypothetical protein